MAFVDGAAQGAAHAQPRGEDRARLGPVEMRDGGEGGGEGGAEERREEEGQSASEVACEGQRSGGSSGFGGRCGLLATLTPPGSNTGSNTGSNRSPRAHHANNHGIALMLAMSRLPACRRAGREPMFRCCSSASGVASWK